MRQTVRNQHGSFYCWVLGSEVLAPKTCTGDVEQHPGVSFRVLPMAADQIQPEFLRLDEADLPPRPGRNVIGHRAMTNALVLDPPLPGTCSMSASFCPKAREQPTQSSMVTFWTGMKGQTSSAPVRGCSPDEQVTQLQRLLLGNGGLNGGVRLT